MSSGKVKNAIGRGAALPLLAASTVSAARLAPTGQSGSTLDPGYLDKLLAPVALYPDQLLAQILLCSGNSSKVGEFSAWLKKNAQRKGSELQEAAQQAGFE